MLEDSSDQFYLYLPSTSNAETFNNTASEFTVQLNRPLELSQNLWECGLSEIFCAKTFQNVVATRNELQVGGNGMNEITLFVPPAYYKHQSDLCTALNNEIKKHKSLNITFKFDTTLDRTQIVMKSNHYVYTKRSSLVGLLLGMAHDVYYQISSSQQQSDAPQRNIDEELKTVNREINKLRAASQENLKKELEFRQQKQLISEHEKNLQARYAGLQLDDQKLIAEQQRLDDLYSQEVEVFRKRDVIIRTQLTGKKQDEELDKLEKEMIKHSVEFNRKYRLRFAEKRERHNKLVKLLDEEKAKITNDFERVDKEIEKWKTAKDTVHENIQKLNSHRVALQKDREKQIKESKLDINRPTSRPVRPSTRPILVPVPSISEKTEPKKSTEQSTTKIDESKEISSEKSKSENLAKVSKKTEQETVTKELQTSKTSSEKDKIATDIESKPNANLLPTEKPKPDLPTIRYEEVNLGRAPEPESLTLTPAKKSKKEIKEAIAYGLTHSEFHEDPATRTITVKQAGTVNTIKNIFCYTDLIQYSNVGFIKAPLLRIVNVPEKLNFGQQLHQSYTNVQYFKLAETRLDTIKLSLKDSWGKNLVFAASDETVFVVHFRRVL